MRSRTETAQETFSNQSIAQDTSESKRTDEPVKKSVRFQLGAPVEVNGQKDLVAVHNLTEENLREALDLGGMPSPSIAVVKAQEWHTKYGPISLVFAPDAWTPTRPNVEYEVRYDAMNAFENKVDRANREAFDGKFKTSAVVQSLGVGETSDMSRAELAQRLQEKTAVQLAYLEAEDQTVKPVYRTEQDSYDALGNDTLEKVIEYAGADEIRNAFESGDMDQLERLADRAADALEEKYTHGTLEGQNKRWQMRITKLHNPYTLENLVAAMNQQNKQSTGHKKQIFLRRQNSAAPTKLARFPSLESST